MINSYIDRNQPVDSEEERQALSEYFIQIVLRDS